RSAVPRLRRCWHLQPQFPRRCWLATLDHMAGRFAVVLITVVAGCSFEPGELADPAGGDDSSGVGQPGKPDAGAVAAACPASYAITLPGSTSHYRLVTTETAWAAAASACAADQP